MNKKLPGVKVGCCGFPCSRKDYFSQFKLVEVQRTFYKMPSLETARRWRLEAPLDFEYSLKAWQLITHPATGPTYRKAGIKVSPGTEEHYGFFKPRDEVLRAWEETTNFARELKARAIVFQCPPSFTETPEHVKNMSRFFTWIRSSSFIYVWEPRGNWDEATIKALCQELELVHCVDPLEKTPLYGKPNYFRLHGGPHYQHHYSKEELRQLLEKVRGEESYVLFNNLNMYYDASAFQQLVENDTSSRW